MKSINMVLIVLGVMVFPLMAATPQVKNVKAMQPYPWENKVYISYEVVGDIAASATKGIVPFLLVSAKDKTTDCIYATATNLPDVNPFLSGDTGIATGFHKIIWDLGAQGVSLNLANVSFVIDYRDDPQYMVIDLSSGENSSSYPISYLTGVPSGEGWTEEYKTTKLVLKWIPPGSFKMQNSYYISLAKSFYMGVFEVTQKQYQLVMGDNPAHYKGWTRPVSEITYNTIRGSEDGAQWPLSSAVDSDSFMGRLRARTEINFDLPTEAQWEYACRAGTTNDFFNANFGRYNIGYDYESDGRGGYSQHTAVGSYLPNAWGLYDMLGNVWEHCLDWYGDLQNGVKDPFGPSLGLYRVLRGGGWSWLSGCPGPSRRASSYDFYDSDGGVYRYIDSNGFRVALPPPN